MTRDNVIGFSVTANEMAEQLVIPQLQIPAAWRHSSGRILGAGWRRILVLGAADRGKSSYCNFLVNALLGAGRSVSFVDADIGQKDVGPPATVSLSNLNAPTPLAQAKCHALYFVGHINPMAHFLPLVTGTNRMVAAAKGDFVVIDTTGLVQGKGRVLKNFQIESLRPDVVICLERGDELAPIRHAYRHHNILRLRPSRLAAGKSSNARRHSRAAAFQAHFQGAREVGLSLDRLIVQRTSLFNGEIFHDPRFLHAERLPEGVIAVARKGAAEAAPAEDDQPQILPAHFADRLLCGIVDRKGDCLGLGIITGIDFPRSSLTLYTPVPRRGIRAIQFGDMYLDQYGRELHLARLGHF